MPHTRPVRELQNQEIKEILESFLQNERKNQKVQEAADWMGTPSHYFQHSIFRNISNRKLVKS